ncbi:hypothetical protein [Alteribacillus sp. HJP-4]|uniref:hypothetical protein n=1 Tax=Alteribacillus sp. HJP-4 TaxID=2775394 RepID=UPI0035CCFBB7
MGKHWITLLNGLLIFAVVFSTFALSAGHAAPAQPNEKDMDEMMLNERDSALVKATFYNTETGTFELDEEIAREHYNFSDEALSSIKIAMEDISPEQAEQLMADANIDIYDTEEEDGASTQVAPALIWGGIAVIGILTGGALIFSSMYFNHQEKTQLIDRCYDEGGNPVVSNQDSAGVNGTTDSGAAERAGGYTFECVN